MKSRDLFTTIRTALASEVLVPEAVALERLVAPASDHARQAMDAGWDQGGNLCQMMERLAIETFFAFD